jgi:hypothetical protein
MNITKLAVSLGAAVAAAKSAKVFTNVGLADMLQYVGLERRRSHVWENLAIFGAGALAGAGTALLLAPQSGRQTRKKIGEGVDTLTTKATEAIADAKAQLLEPEKGAIQEPDMQRGNSGSHIR